MSWIKVNLDEISAYVHAEFSEAALNKDLSEEYCIWCVLRTLGKFWSKGKGKVELKTAISTAANILGTSERTIEKHIPSGVGIFWRLHGQHMYLIGIMKASVQLDLDAVNADRFIVPFANFAGNKTDRKKLLLFTVAGRDVGSPVSAISLAERCGMSVRTVRRLLADSKFGEKIVNYRLLWQIEDKQEAIEAIAQDPALSIRRMKGQDKPWLMRRMPNSWWSKLDRKPLYKERRRFLLSLGESGVFKSRIYQRSVDEMGAFEEVGYASLGSDVAARESGPAVKVWRNK